MQNKTVTLKGVKVITNVINGVQSYSYETGNSYVNNVVASPIVKGDFRNPNNHSYTVSNGTYYSGSGSTYTDSKNYTNETGVYSGLGYPSAVVPSSSFGYNRALGKLYDAYRGSLDLSIDAGQLRQTKSMFNAVEKAEAFFVRRASLIKKAGSAWLEYVYGWKPLLHDIYDIADNAARSPGGYLSVTRARDVLRNDDTVTQRAYPYTYVTRTLDKVAVAFSVTYQTRGGFDISRWSSLNPVSIAWELMPYSFVVDWFYDVGGYMRSLESALISNKNFVGGYVSILNRREVQRNRGFGFTSGGVIYKEALVGYASQTVFSRSKLTAPPLPRSPTLRSDLGASRLLSAASLLSQFLKH